MLVPHALLLTLLLVALLVERVEALSRSRQFPRAEPDQAEIVLPTEDMFDFAGPLKILAVAASTGGPTAMGSSANMRARRGGLLLSRSISMQRRVIGAGMMARWRWVRSYA